MTADEDSFSIEYSITPPLPEESDGESTVLLMLEARDDLGNEYSDWGGTFGTSADGKQTEGTVSGQPGLPAGTRELFVRFTYLRAGEETSYDLTLPVPFTG
ncbi:hypothetical protein J4032_10345 [Streptomyces formicae]|uniref:Uncharacterized protein n=1 Tax=Streptomyces formicae TaxID=1616117 RepID=A0ABY3X337_9ACTN|nr:hypothetical protein J4032_10345 [Streptomyces formicae]